MKLKETQIQKMILDYLKYIGAYSGKTKTMGIKRGGRWCFDKYLFVGFPDITFFFNHNIYFVEVKAKGNKQTPAQLIFESHCKLANVKYILAYSLDDVISALEGNGNS